MRLSLSEDIRSEGDDDERLEELYNDAKAESNANSQLRGFDDLFSIELAMQKKTVWGFKAAKRLLKNALEQSNLDAATIRYRQLQSYSSAVTSNDFDGCVSKMVNSLESLSQTEILSALLSITITDETLTSVGARTSIKLAQPLVRLQPNERTLASLTELQHRLEGTNTVAKITTNLCLLELYALEMELLWRMGRFENMDLAYSKAMSMEDTLLGSQHLSSAHGYYGRYLLRFDKPLNALVYLVKAVEDEATSIDVEHHTACVQSLALVTYTSADTGADEVLNKYSGRLDVAAIRRFGVAFLSEDADELEQVLVETDGAFKDREVWRLLRHYETVLKRKLCLKSSPLPADCWSDVLQCLTHPVWHELQTLCRKFDPILAPLLHHLHSDVQKTRFEYPYTRWHIIVYSKSGRPTKVVHHNGILSDAVLARAVMQEVLFVEIKAATWVTDEGIVRFCFGGDGRRLEILKPNITGDLLPRLVEEHSSTANHQEFTLIVACRSVTMSDVRLRSAAAYSQYRVGKTDSSATYEIPSDTALLTIHLAYDVRELGTMTVVRKRLTTAESSVDEKTDV